MGIINFPNKYKFTGRGYLDVKVNQLFKTVDELNKATPASTRFLGYTAIVLTDEAGVPGPWEYWIVDEKGNWEKKRTAASTEDVKLIYDKQSGIIQLNCGGEASSYITLAEDLHGRYVRNVELVREKPNDAQPSQPISGIFLKVTYEGYSKEEIEAFTDADTRKAKEEQFKQKVVYLDLGEIAGAAYTGGNGISVKDGVISIEDSWVNEHIDKKIASLSDQVSKLAGKVTKNEENIGSLSEKIELISKGKTEVDNKTIEYTPDEKGAEKLSVKVSASADNLITKESDGIAVKVSKVEGNIIKKENDGISAIIPLSGNDVNTEIGYENQKQ